MQYDNRQSLNWQIDRFLPLCRKEGWSSLPALCVDSLVSLHYSGTILLRVSWQQQNLPGFESLKALDIKHDQKNVCLFWQFRQLCWQVVWGYGLAFRMFSNFNQIMWISKPSSQHCQYQKCSKICFSIWNNISFGMNVKRLINQCCGIIFCKK